MRPSWPPWRTGWSAAVLAGALVVPLAAGLVVNSLASTGVEWPADVAPVAAFVAHDRGLSFHQAVPIHMLSIKQFNREVASQDVPETAGQRADDRRYEAQLRALGLLGGHVDLSGAQSSLDTSDVDGYYEDTKSGITLRGQTLTPGNRVVLAHELTHALQDQHFNLNRLDDTTNTSEQETALTALEEGDAVLEEDDYLDSLRPGIEKVANAEANGAGSGSGSGSGSSSGGGAEGSGTPGTTGDSDVLSVLDEVPYVLGPDMVEALYAEGGNARIDRAYRQLPRTELDFLLPTAYLAGVPVRHLSPPRLLATEKRDGQPDSFGAFMLYLTLASRIDDRTALTAADGWGGGSLVQYKPAGSNRVCTRVDVAGRTPADRSVIAAAIEQWAAAMPLGQAMVSTVGNLLEISSCDPGHTARTGHHSLEDALTLADRRDFNIDNALGAGFDDTVATCVGDRALDDHALLNAENAVDNATGAPPAASQHAIDREVQQLGEACQGGPSGNA